MLLRSFESFEKTENGYLIHGDAADVKLIFMTDDIIRIRVHFDKGTPMEEESYTLVTTAWEDRMDTLLKDERTRITALDVPCAEDDKTLTFETAHLTLKLFKKPFHFELYDKSGKLIYQDLRERAFEKDQIGRLSHFSKVDREFDHFYGFGEKTGHLDKKGRRLRMSPKDAIGHDPETGDPMYKHIPFYVRVNEHDLRPVGLFYHNSYDCVFDLGEELSGYWERYCYYQTDGGDIDLFLLAGETLPEILNEYTLLTQRPAHQAVSGLLRLHHVLRRAGKELRRRDLQGHRQARKRGHPHRQLLAGLRLFQRRKGQPALCVQLEPQALPGSGNVL